MNKLFVLVDPDSTSSASTRIEPIVIVGPFDDEGQAESFITAFKMIQPTAEAEVVQLVLTAEEALRQYGPE